MKLSEEGAAVHKQSKLLLGRLLVVKFSAGKTSSVIKLTDGQSLNVPYAASARHRLQTFLFSVRPKNANEDFFIDA